MILVIGLDGFPYEWHDRLDGAGFHTAPLHSPHAMSMPAWNSLFSGLRPETHGFEGLPLPKAPKGRIRYLWDHLAADGRDTIAVNIPFIWPPMLMRLHVCGYPAPPDNYVFPRRRQPEWPYGCRHLNALHRDMAPWDFHILPDEQLFAEAKQGRWTLAHRFREELARGIPDVGILVFCDLDALSHVAYTTMQGDGKWEVVDELLLAIEQIAGGCAPEWTFVVSDHGLDFSQKPPKGTPDDDVRVTHGVGLGNSEQGIFAYRSKKAAALPADTALVQEDLVPTILFLLDAPPVGKLEGLARTEIMREADGDDEHVRRQLEGLGYV